jgi:hypothetical protein
MKELVYRQPAPGRIGGSRLRPKRGFNILGKMHRPRSKIGFDGSTRYV